MPFTPPGPRLNYQKLFDDAIAEVDGLLKEREKAEEVVAGIDRQIRAAMSVLTAAGPVIGKAPPQKLRHLLIQNIKENAAEIGMTEQIRAVLRNGSHSPVEVRDALKDSGVNLEGYSNALATIHNVIKRLVDSGEATESQTEEGKKYRIRPRFRISAPESGTDD